MRPGAPLAPSWVWQLLQSPVICGVYIGRSLSPFTTFAVIGNISAPLSLTSYTKLPELFTASFTTFASAVVIST